jgi:hypothetical protein
MSDFAIIDPKHGIAEDMPSVTLSEAFMAKGSKNVHYRYGRYDRIKGRLAELTDSEGVKIKAPTDVYTITSIVTGTKTINITGDHSAGNTVLAIGDTIRINGGTTAANNITFKVATLPTSSSITTVEDLTAEGATPGNLFVGTTPVLRYHRHIKHSTQGEYLILGTKYHLLVWSLVDLSLTVKWTNTLPNAVTRWEIIDHLRNVVATNNSDKVLWWNIDGSAGNNFSVLDDAANGIDVADGTTFLTACKHITSFERYLILGYTTEGGIAYPQRIRWASLGTGGTDIDFDENGDGDAGSKDFTSTKGFLMGFGRHGDNLVVSKQDSMHRGWIVTADTVFEWQEYTLKVGNLSADSIINDKAGRMYWIASDLTIREIETPDAISTLVDVTMKNMNTSQAEYIQGTWIDEFEEIWWAIPSNNSDTNDVIVSFHPNSGRAHISEIPVRAFGDFTQQAAFTYDTLPYATYADWGAAWLIYDTPRNIVGFPLDIASDYLGNTFDLHTTINDDITTFTGIVIFSTTLSSPKSLNLYKRINNGADFIFNRKSAGSAAIYVKRDTEKSWQSLGTVSFTDSNEPETVIVHLPFDMRAKSFLFKIESTDDMEFIGIIFRDFEVDDNR